VWNYLKVNPKILLLKRPWRYNWIITHFFTQKEIHIVRACLSVSVMIQFLNSSFGVGFDTKLFLRGEWTSVVKYEFWSIVYLGLVRHLNI
jgi:hypothetical protein